MSEPALEVVALSAGYVPGLPIIIDINLQVDLHEIVTIIGPNGAGKSTLIKAIAGLVRIESGQVLAHGVEITGIHTNRLIERGLAYVPQTANIFRKLTIEQNLAVAATRCRADRQAATTTMLELFPLLNEKFREKAGTLSGGQRQFLALAMALIARPSVLLLDEPTAGLSPIAARQVFALLRDLVARDVSILLVEQNARAALRHSDRAYILADGQNQHTGNALELLNDKTVGEIYLGARRKRPLGGAHAAKSV
jgi:ABC-type branched-subunit amino acid transport system ATPase component